MTGAGGLAALVARLPDLSECRPQIAAAAGLLIEVFAGGCKLLLCGNGGSAADCEHIAGELLKGFERKRPLSREVRAKLAAQGAEGAALAEKLQRALPAVSLTGHPSLATAFANDVDPALTFAQLAAALGRPGDALLAISTSGNARNVVLAARAAGALGMRTLALTGRGGGALAPVCDVAIIAPGDTVAEVQERHLPIYHHLCREIEAHFFPE